MTSGIEKTPKKRNRRPRRTQFPTFNDFRGAGGGGTEGIVKINNGLVMEKASGSKKRTPATPKEPKPKGKTWGIG